MMIAARGYAQRSHESPTPLLSFVVFVVFCFTRL
jgi:hypothetical protein